MYSGRSAMNIRRAHRPQWGFLIFAGLAPGAFAVPVASPALAGQLTLTPLIDARIRYEGVDQQDKARQADAVTFRVRSGVEAKTGPWSMLAEAEATLAIAEDYNSTVNGRTGFPVVADPETIELNRLQVQYRGLPKTVVTLGRQRINLDDQRFVGTVLWRQNEQTYDAVRLESSALGPLTADITYSWAVRSIFGIDSPLQSIGGDNVLAQLGGRFGPVAIKGFAYLIDQDQAGRRQFSSQTYGARATGSFPLTPRLKLGLIGSYARQSDYRGNANSYAADYWLGEAQLAAYGFTLTGGYEVLGAASGRAFTSFQTPLATAHKFNGWADLFLTTPANGLRDTYAGLGYVLPTVRGPVNLTIISHRFDSDRLGQKYGDEWNAQATFKLTRNIGLLVKYADYRADQFGTDTRRLWLQLEYLL
ncbi:alginate export family protein [Sphingomonas sp. 37zxx]|uniref:alginate export family protein n=1 Tax=Sphingomonas sp. 37zxx TaxID=1550073 RepID=UPI002F3FCE24